MKKLRHLTLILLGALLLSACGAHATGRAEQPALTARETAEQLMESLRSLNLDLFNDYSDNCIRTEKNWMGIPVRREYQVFNDLLEPFPRNRKRYQANWQLSQKLMENLTWEIKDVRENGTQAEIDMEITNIDMLKATGYYEISLLENMVADEDAGFFQFIRDMSGLIYSVGSVEGLILAMDQLDESDLSTIDITVQARLENGVWKILLNEDFINAFMGNINSEGYTEDIRRKVEELTLQYEEKVDRMAEQFAQKLETFAE